MKLFKIAPRFFIFFTLLTLIPATWIAKNFQYLLQQLIDTNLIKQLIDWGLIETPTTIVIICILFWVYELYLWKIWPFRYVHQVPNINGRYEGEGYSKFKNAKYKIALEIKQSLLNIAVSLYSERSSSYSNVANIGKNENGNWALSYVYRNNPKTISDDLDMRIHDGFAVLEIFKKEKRLKGAYFNDLRERKTFGSINCKFVSNEKKGHF